MEIQASVHIGDLGTVHGFGTVHEAKLFAAEQRRFWGVTANEESRLQVFVVDEWKGWREIFWSAKLQQYEG